MKKGKKLNKISGQRMPRVPRLFNEQEVRCQGSEYLFDVKGEAATPITLLLNGTSDNLLLSPSPFFTTNQRVFTMAAIYSYWKVHYIRFRYIAQCADTFTGGFSMAVFDDTEEVATTVSAATCNRARTHVTTAARNSVQMLFRPQPARWLACSRTGETSDAVNRECAVGFFMISPTTCIAMATGSTLGVMVVDFDISFRGDASSSAPTLFRNFPASANALGLIADVYAEDEKDDSKSVASGYECPADMVMVPRSSLSRR